MLKSSGWGGVVVVAYKILETANSPISSFPFYFCFWAQTWDLDSGLLIIKK